MQQSEWQTFIPVDEEVRIENPDLGLVIKTMEAIRTLTELCATDSEDHKRTLVEIASYLAIEEDLPSLSQEQLCRSIREMVDEVLLQAESQTVDCINDTDILGDPIAEMEKKKIYSYGKNEKTGKSHCLSEGDIEGMINRDREDRHIQGKAPYKYTEPYSRLGDLREIKSSTGVPVITDYILRTSK